MDHGGDRSRGWRMKRILLAVLILAVVLWLFDVFGLFGAVTDVGK